MMIKINTVLIIVIIIGLTGSAFGEQISSTTEQSKDGEQVTTTLYKNESSYRIKSVAYGTLPHYRLVIDYFEKGNPKDLIYEENYNVDMSAPNWVNGKPEKTIGYYIADQVDGMVKVVRNYMVDRYIDEYTYTENNKKGLISTVNTVLFSNKVVLQIFTYKDSEENQHKNKVSFTYDLNSEVLFEVIDYYNTSTEKNYIVEDSFQFVPGKYDIRENKPYQEKTTFKNHPKGMYERDVLNTDDGYQKQTLKYDPSLHNGIKEVVFILNSKLSIVRYVAFYETLKDGKYTGVSLLYHDDGTKTQTYFDANGNELVNEATTIPAK